MAQEQDQDLEFERGFASVMGLDDVASAPAADNAADAGATVDEVPDAEGETAAATAEQGNDATGGEATAQPEQAGEQQPAAKADAKPEGGENQPEPGAEQPGSAEADAEQQKLVAGLTEDELRNLLGRAAEVDGLKDSLRRAHGRIGEMMSRLKDHPAQGAAHGGVNFSGLEGEAFDSAVSDVIARAKLDTAMLGDYSEEAMMRGLVGMVLRTQGLLGSGGAAQVQAPTPAPSPATPQTEPTQYAQAPTQAPVDYQAQAAAYAATQTAQQQNQPDPSSADFEVERRVLDRLRPKWRDTVSGTNFNLWLTTQGESVQQEYRQANTADSFAGVLDKFEQWETARNAAVSKSAQGQKRLENAMTPTGNAPRPQAAPTEDEQFLAAFDSVMKQRN